jgi:hypothetical protein
MVVDSSGNAVVVYGPEAFNGTISPSGSLTAVSTADGSKLVVSFGSPGSQIIGNGYLYQAGGGSSSVQLILNLV